MKELEQWITKNIPEKHRELYSYAFTQVLTGQRDANSFEYKLIKELYPEAKIKLKG